MRKVRTDQVDLVGIDSEGRQRVVDTYTQETWDPVHLGDVGENMFRAANISNPGERAMRGAPGMSSVGGDDQTYSPKDMPNPKRPRGGSPV